MEYTTSLINDYLDISKINTGKISLDISEFNLKDLIKDTLIYSGAEGVNKNSTQFNSNSEEIILYSDQKTLKRLIVNILSNAKKFTHNGVIIVEVEKCDNKAAIKISDNGIGMNEEQKQKLFLPFQ
ncbi:HAMP domain-containing histidine kinase [Candidatus Peregrinibacteria bacterium]|nr:HAMP domain-containing histidine kinase [Candidatus Peregrinibacteria bacterium]